MSINKIILVGNVGKDPQVREVNGKKVATFSLAVKDRVTDETEWFNVEVWEKKAEVVERYVAKGMLLYVEGRLRTRKYTGNDGAERTAIDVRCSELQMLSRKEQDAPAVQQAAAPFIAGIAGVGSVQENDGDLPF